MVAVISAGYAYLQWRTARHHAREQQAAQIEAMRPYVTVTVEPNLASRQLFDLIIRNIGERPAKDVSISIDPPPQRVREIEQKDLQMRNMKILKQPMALLAPGQEIRALYDSHIERADHPELPTEHDVVVTYTDTSSKQYDGDFVLDLEALKGMSWTEVGSIHTISKSLEKIAKTLTRSGVLRPRSSVEVHAVTETREQAELRKSRRDLESQALGIDLLARISPNDKSLPQKRAKLDGHLEEEQRERERKAVEPLVRVVTRAMDVCRYTLRGTASLRSGNRTSKDGRE